MQNVLWVYLVRLLLALPMDTARATLYRQIMGCKSRVKAALIMQLSERRSVESCAKAPESGPQIETFVQVVVTAGITKSIQTQTLRGMWLREGGFADDVRMQSSLLAPPDPRGPEVAGQGNAW